MGNNKGDKKMDKEHFIDTFAYEIEFCKKAHGEQKRKYTGEPYWTHPAAVAYRLWLLGLPHDVIAAAILHDVIEDTDWTFEKLRSFFGVQTLVHVLEVTDISKPSDGNRAARKKIDREHIAKASYYGKCIKLADMIDNTSTIVKHDMGFAKVYLAEKKELLKVLYDGHPLLYQYAKDLLEVSLVAVEEWENN